MKLSLQGEGEPRACEASLDALHRDVYANNMAPYWPVVDRSVAHDEDRQIQQGRKAIPFIWKYQRQIEPLLRRSAALIKTETSERRSLVLVNPGLAPQRATASTLYVAYRVNDPNEIMPPHRHSPNAIRLGLTGVTNFTGVEGENIVFGPGDLVLTPPRLPGTTTATRAMSRRSISACSICRWRRIPGTACTSEHDYTEEEEGVRILAARCQTERFPASYSQRVPTAAWRASCRVSSRTIGARAPPRRCTCYRYEAAREFLENCRDWDGDRYEALMLEYVNPTTGGPVYKTMTFFMQMLRPGERTLPLKQSANLVFSPFEGAGYSMIWRQAHRLGALRYGRRPRRNLVPARQRVRQTAGDSIRGQR